MKKKVFFGLSKKVTCLRGRVAEMSTIVFDGGHIRKVKTLKTPLRDNPPLKTTISNKK